MVFNAVWDSQTAIKRKNARMFHRLATGNQIATWQDQDIRALTLTTAKERVYYRNRKGEIVERGLKQSWAALRKAIKRFFGWSLNKYYAVRTSEGNGTYHIVFWGGEYIPQDWLSKMWQKIHGAKIVYIQRVKKKTVSGLTGYLLDRYLMNQPIERISYGWGWAWLGFCKSWENFKLTYNNMRASKQKRENGQIIDDTEHTQYIREEEVKIHYVPFKMRVTHHATRAWKKILANKRKTSRQLKFFYPNRGWQIERFNLCW